MTNLADSLLTDVAFSDELDFLLSPQGGIATSTGIANLRAALLRRLLTVPGSLISLADYGVGLKRYQNAPLTLSVQRELATLIKEQFERDSRVQRVTSVRMTQDAVDFSRIEIETKIEVVGAEALELTFQTLGE